jgi:hypothetical protein
VDSPEGSGPYIDKLFNNEQFKNAIIEKAYSDVQQFVNIQTNVVEEMLIRLKSNM